MQPDAKHQQHHANFGQLRRRLDVGDKTRRRRADDDASQQIADQRRQFQAFGNHTENERPPKGSGDGGDQ